ncbi:MAG: NRDE family protein [Actinobacteria bacterium]|nr:NRDE family protein [Actinomycetota bacterium]
MCLLITLFQVVPGAPLVVAANRDERLDRPAIVATVLREAGPRIIGGRDLLAGGTWLAVNDRGVVAGLTNQPTADGRDPTKRSRGELPLVCANQPTAKDAVDALTADVDPARYNPCWMLVGDRDAMFSVGIGAGSAAPEIESLGPGLHVLENAPLRAQSPKAQFVRRLVEQGMAEHPNAGLAGVTEILRAVLRDHRPAVPEPRTDDSGRVWPPSLTAACVHADGYGTRSSAIVTVPAAGLPSMLVADGKPCETPMRDVSELWTTYQVADEVPR